MPFVQFVEPLADCPFFSRIHVDHAGLERVPGPLAKCLAGLWFVMPD